MRRGPFLILSLTLAVAGCASQPAQPAAVTAPPPEPVYDDAVAAALVYEPPVMVDQPRLEIPRENRAQSAYVGFEELTATYYYLWQDDRQLNYGNSNHHDRFERRAISVKTGVTYR